MRYHLPRASARNLRVEVPAVPPLSLCPAWCERPGPHSIVHETLWASEAGVEVWLQQLFATRPLIKVAVTVEGDDVAALWPSVHDAATLAVIFDWLGRAKLGEALRRCARIVAAAAEAEAEAAAAEAAAKARERRVSVACTYYVMSSSDIDPEPRILSRHASEWSALRAAARQRHLAYGDPSHRVYVVPKAATGGESR